MSRAFNESKMVKARKDHSCDQCDRTIKTGEAYEYWAGLSIDSQFFTFKQCAHCADLLAKLTRVDYDSFEEGGLIADWISQDMIREIELPEDDVVPLLRQCAYFRRKWTDATGDLYPIEARA